MPTLKLGSTTAMTESGGTVTLDSGVTGIPAAGITGTLGSGVFPDGVPTAMGFITKTLLIKFRRFGSKST